MSATPRIRIAIDAMGGDAAPREPVRAAARVSRGTSIDVVLVGHPDRMRAELDEVEHDARRIDLRPAPDVIAMDEKPGEALTRKPNASIAVAARLVAAGEAEALVSAGSTGGIVLAAAKNIPRIEGVKRAALAAVHPTRERAGSRDRFSLLLDVGATVRCNAQDLLFFAYMGHAYASRISKVAHPTIGLLNLGEEETKGDEILRTAHRLMKRDPRLNFIGNVEGTALPVGIADVIVCEGFVGNVVLKMAEGMSEVMAGLGKWAFKERFLWRLGLVLLSSGLKQLKSVTDYSEYGGAPLLGFERLVIKAHGRSHARALANAIKVAAKAARDGVCDEIREAVGSFEGQSPDQEGP